MIVVAMKALMIERLGSLRLTTLKRNRVPTNTKHIPNMSSGVAFGTAKMAVRKNKRGSGTKLFHILMDLAKFTLTSGSGLGTAVGFGFERFLASIVRLSSNGLSSSLMKLITLFANFTMSFELFTATCRFSSCGDRTLKVFNAASRFSSSSCSKAAFLKERSSASISCNFARLLSL